MWGRRFADVVAAAVDSEYRLVSSLIHLCAEGEVARGVV